MRHKYAPMAADYIVAATVDDICKMVTNGELDDLRQLVWEFMNFDGMEDEDIIAQAEGLGWGEPP